MKILFSVGVVALVLLGISKLRNRGDANTWQEATAH